LASYSKKIDAVINCTGTHPGIQEISENLTDEVIEIIGKNVKPAVNIYQAFLPVFMKRKSGHFIHVSSAALDFFEGSEAGYCASKSALESIILCFQNLSKEDDILHHAVRLSLTDTPLARKVCPDIVDWEKFYTAEENASYLVDMMEHPENYPKTIVSIPYRPIR